MKRIIGLLALCAILAAPALAAAKNLPDNYQANGQLSIKGSCDEGKTTVNIYETDEWTVLEVLPASGNNLFVMSKDLFGLGVEFYFVKRAGSNQTNAVTLDQWKKALQENSPNFFQVAFGSEQTDCRPSD